MRRLKICLFWAQRARLAAVGHNRGYYVVRITPEERKQRAVSMGYDARKQQLAAAPKDTDDTDVTDVF